VSRASAATVRFTAVMPPTTGTRRRRTGGLALKPPPPGGSPDCSLMSPPEFSIVVPAYNAGRTISAAFAS
jgi:hypothetical protein